MDEIWERAVDAALDGQTDVASVRSLTLDGAVKCLHGRLPQPSLFEKFHSLQHFSIANIGVSSLEQFPRLRNLQRLILSDNRIAGGLEFLVEAGLESLRDLDLSNNRISDINDLRPLAELRLVSLDLYECSVTRTKDYRAQVFGLIRSLKYLDKMDVDENERPESDEEDEDEEEEEDDPGSGEVDGEDHPFRLNNGDQAGREGVVDVDEDEESDADEEESETPRVVNGLSRGSRDSHPHSNGFGVVAVDGDDDDDDDDDGEEDDDLVEVYEDDEGEDEDVVEVHEIDDSEDEDGVEYDEDEEEEEEEDEDDEEEVNNDERDFGEVGGTGRSTSMEGEIDGHEQGEVDVDEDDNGETGEEEQAVEEDGDFDDEDEEEDYGNGYLVQPVGRAEPQTAGSDVDPGDEDEDPEIEEDLEEYEEEEENLDGEIQELPSSSSHKRKRNEDSLDDGDDCEDEDGDDMMPYNKSSKHH